MIFGRVTPSKERETKRGESMIFCHSVEPTAVHFRPNKDTYDKHRPWWLFCIYSTSLQLGKARAGRRLRGIGTSAPHCHHFGHESLRRMSASFEDEHRHIFGYAGVQLRPLLSTERPLRQAAAVRFLRSSQRFLRLHGQSTSTTVYIRRCRTSREETAPV